MLLNEVPAVLRVDVYAVAAIAGAVVTVVALLRRTRPVVAFGLGIAVCFALRLGAILGRWNLPRAT